LDISVKTSEKRFKASGKVRDRLELNDREFFIKIKDGYTCRAASDIDRISIVNGELSIEEIEHIIFGQVLYIIKSKYGLNNYSILLY
jgi:thymidylate kinase